MRQIEVKQMSKDAKRAVYVILFAIVATVVTAALGLATG
jgi:hypothetical protein